MNEKEKMPNFDFDHWCKVAREEPEKFEVMRRQMIDDLIAQAPSHLKPQITGLQWQVDRIRQQAGNPMAACVRISRKMWANVLGKNGLLKALQEPKELLNSLKNAPTAKVLPFERPRPGK